ncbi:hypothetical protein [Sphingobium sp.]|jgi:predicted nucleotidyltransferase|nr:hypothetical protein [Sphingobium sp.]MBJ7375544.1 hypothetical protein [Sphingobium sp.]
MTVRGQLLEMLAAVATAIGDELREQLVFVGGCSSALLITDPYTIEDVRMTDDVDLIVNLTGKGKWLVLQDQLSRSGFKVASEDGLMCRMRLGELKVDFMPDDAALLGFTNRWYARGIETAVTATLTPDLQIKHLTAPYFLATKLEAYLGRGGNDPLRSHDLEDVLLVIDGREELLAEVLEADDDVRTFIAKQLRDLQAHEYFDSFLDGNIRGSSGREDVVRSRIEALAGYHGEG